MKTFQWLQAMYENGNISKEIFLERLVEAKDSMLLDLDEIYKLIEQLKSK